MTFKTDNLNMIMITTKLCVLLLLVCACVAAAKVISFTLSSDEISAGIDRSVSVTEKNKVQITKYKEKYLSLANELKKKSLFVPPKAAPRTNPVRSVDAICGDEVLINGGDKWFREGDKIKDAEILEITPVEVKVSWNKQEVSLYPFDFITIKTNSRSTPKNPSRNSSDRGPGVKRRTSQPGRMPPGGMKSSGKRRARRERFRNMSPEKRREMVQQFRERRNNRSNSNNRRSSRNRGERKFRRRENAQGGFKE